MIGDHDREEIEHEESGFMGNNQREIKNPHESHYYVLAAFVIVVAGILIFNFYKANDQDRIDAQFYRNHIMTFELIDFWKMSEEDQEKQQKDVGKKILDQAEHKVSRQELGHNSWTFLHMVTGGFPDQIPEPLAKKFNAFLVLFGQMFPCKLCANHFMELLKKEGLFKGTSKHELMEYLCNIHNKVNERLGKPIHDCTTVYEEWNTCGCSQS